MLSSGRYADAIRIYQEALRFDSEMAGLHNNLATAFLGSNDLTRAEQHYQQAVQLDPTVFPALFNLGRVLAATGRKEDARAALQRALQLRPAEPRALEAMRQLGN